MNGFINSLKPLRHLDWQLVHSDAPMGSDREEEGWQLQCF